MNSAIIFESDHIVHTHFFRLTKITARAKMFLIHTSLHCFWPRKKANIKRYRTVSEQILRKRDAERETENEKRIFFSQKNKLIASILLAVRHRNVWSATLDVHSYRSMPAKFVQHGECGERARQRDATMLPSAVFDSCRKTN